MMKERINKLVELGFTYNKIATLAKVPITSLNEWCKGNRKHIRDEYMEKLETWLEEYKRQIAEL